jgi:hypothetical protein
MMFNVNQYRCSSCGASTSAPGECIVCSTRSEYRRGFDAGQRQAGFTPVRYDPPPIDIRTDYQKGFDAGSGRDSRDSLGCSGDGIFVFIGD